MDSHVRQDELEAWEAKYQPSFSRDSPYGNRGSDYLDYVLQSREFQYRGTHLPDGAFLEHLREREDFVSNCRSGVCWSGVVLVSSQAGDLFLHSHS